MQRFWCRWFEFFINFLFLSPIRSYSQQSREEREKLHSSINNNKGSYLPKKKKQQGQWKRKINNIYYSENLCWISSKFMLPINFAEYLQNFGTSVQKNIKGHFCPCFNTGGRGYGSGGATLFLFLKFKVFFC